MNKLQEHIQIILENGRYYWAKLVGYNFSAI